jgi:DNA modification methylase
LISNNTENIITITMSLIKSKDEYKNAKKQVIINEDCITGMQQMENDSVDIIICDPPYNIGKDFGNDSDKQNMDDYLLWCDKWIKECIRKKEHYTSMDLVKY